MTKRIKRSFTLESRLEAALLVVEQNDSVTQAANAMEVGKSTIDK